MKCPFCDPKKVDLKDNPNFDNPKEHLIIVITKEDHVHIHGPFEKHDTMRSLLKFLHIEMDKQGIEYFTPPKAKF